MRFERVTIVGIGLIGASFGLAAKRVGKAGLVTGVARSKATLDGALNVGAADEVTTDLEAAVRSADLVYLAAPVGAIPDLLQRIAGSVREGCIVTDGGSCKREICAAGDRLFIDGRFVGGHPMAGSEQSGPLAARADLFEGMTYFLTPTRRTSASAVEAIRDLVQALGARPAIASPEAHDRTVAATSHLPHLAAVALARVVEQGLESDLRSLDGIGRGFLDATRLASGDPELWADICVANADEIQPCLDALNAELDALRSAVARRDRKRIVEILTSAHHAREQLAR